MSQKKTAAIVAIVALVALGAAAWFWHQRREAHDANRLELHGNVDIRQAVWELRRYCQVLNVFGKKLIPVEQQMLDFALEALRLSSFSPRHTFRIPGGYLEEMAQPQLRSLKSQDREGARCDARVQRTSVPVP